MIMAKLPALENDVRAQRDGRGWSQEELARRSGLSRAGVSAIETGRLVPSAAAALALAGAFGLRVEDLFHLPRARTEEPAWAWAPARPSCRYWEAQVAGRTRLYPVEASPLGVVPHDGTYQGGVFQHCGRSEPADTLVVASCDPAGGLLAAELARVSGVRLIVLPRTSATALALLKQGLIHAAGIHLSRSDEPEGNADEVRDRVGRGVSLLHVANWEEGLTFAPAQRITSVQAALGSGLRWIGRESGSGARQCLDELLGTRRPPRRMASDHRGVAEAIRSGWADLGVCLRLASEEAGLEFLSIRREAYDLCFPQALKSDPRLKALIDTVRSPSYRRLLGALPGYDCADSGRLQHIN
jgi:molybdate-binding protein/transcriptional regulator with XRE-family HTH domain